MMRSLYAGVAGLTAHQIKMDVIGSNIANVNTVAYKSQSVNFSDLMYQTIQKASGSNENTGGVNPKQIGLGVKVAGFNNSILQQGSAQNTGNAFDLMISGNSFFAVSNGSETLYTRDGSFNVDAVGNLVMSSNGYNVMGWVAQKDENGEISIDYNSNLKKLQIMNPENLTCEPVSTSKALCSGNIDSTDLNINSTEGKVINLNFYDNTGYKHTAKFNLTKENENQFKLTLTSINNEAGIPLSDEDFEHVSFGEEKSILISFDAATGKIIGNGLEKITFDREYENLSSYGLVSNDEFDGTLEIDYSTLTNFNTEGISTINITSGDSKGFNAGCSTGEMIGTSISNNGQIYANYSNGLTKLLGQIATARFSNAAGLLREGDNLYSQSLNSGEAVLEDITASGGYMQTGVLEMSNVDLSKEFTEMIITQRGFQANSRIITVSDTMLEELTNLKR